MLLQWIIVILICAAAFACAAFKVYKTYKNKGKDSNCRSCAYSDKCLKK
jgi:hypothetical protein